MTDWEVTIVTESNYIKKIRVDNCITREDAEFQALSMTGARKIINSSPKTYYNKDQYEIQSEESQVIENHYHSSKQNDDDNDEKNFHSSLDKMEIEMYDLLCQIHMSEGKKLPTIGEFYEYLNT